MMENVYVIKVKTRPPLSSLYPSERRYSASTVGGLSFVHFFLGAVSLLLGSLASSLQGPVLSVACLVPFVTGLLAWRRWYIDRNIAIFFYGSLFSLVAAVLCFVVTALDIAAVADARTSFWSLEKILEPSGARSPPREHRRNETIAVEAFEDAFNSNESSEPWEDNSYAPTPGIILDSMSNISGYVLRSSGDVATSGKNREERIDPQLGNFTEGSAIDGGIPFRERDRRSRSNILLTVNVLVASILEASWSALSASIALRGMMNRSQESGCQAGRGKGTGAAKRKSPAPRPDILDHDRGLTESLQNLNALHRIRNHAPGLPLPESSGEFRERVERFLANQAAHRLVEGSCS